MFPATLTHTYIRINVFTAQANQFTCNVNVNTEIPIDQLEH